jgi:hypothetical protein
VYLTRVPGVRIPLSPQNLNNPATGRVVCFGEAPKEACFLKVMSQNKLNRDSGYLSFAGNP